MLGALGIGALIGALGAKQRGGNMLKGALTGGILGGIGGHFFGKGIGGVGGQGGIFGFGKGMMANLVPAAMIGMGTEMAGQQEANAAALAGRRRLLEEEEERRLDRLRQIAGYDIADSKNFLTPQSYFGRARGGLATLPKPGYMAGGDVDYEKQAMIQSLLSQRMIEDDPEKVKIIDIKLEELGIPQKARGGRIHAKDGMYLDDGFQYDIEIDGDKYSYGFDEELTEEGLDALRKRENIMKMLRRGEGEYEHPLGRPGMGEYEYPLGRPGMGEYEFMAQGGIADLDMRSGGHSIGPGTGTSDDVPAMLSDGEFVVTAKAVENLGGGDRMLGAKRMYNMMNTLDPNSQTPGEMNYVGHG